jgi:transposase
LTADLAPLLQQWVKGGPVQQGLGRANWTYAELADHLYKAKGIRVQKSAMQVFCSRHGIRPYRPTYRFLRGDPAKQAAAREDLAGLKKKRRPANSSC